MENAKTIKLNYLEIVDNQLWFEKLPKSKQYPRHWITTVNLEITLSNKQILKSAAGTIWDGASIPSWLWWIFKPIDNGAIGDFIHDELWGNKITQISYFYEKYGETNFSLFDVRLFADNERLKWRKVAEPNKKIKNIITHRVIRWLGGFFYSRQFKIPN